MENYIFRYELADAWGDTITKVEIVDGWLNNVRCVYPCVSFYVGHDIPKGNVYTLNEQQIKKIKSILYQNMDIFDINEVEDSFCVDGYINTFYFSIEGLDNEIIASNISVFRKDESVKAKKVLDVFDKVVKILSQNGVDKQYCRLSLE